MREESLKELVDSFGYNAKVTCDPALFLTAKEWDKVFPQKENNRRNYLLFVNYIEGSFNIESVKELAKSKGLDYVCINGSAIKQNNHEDLNNVAPYELFDYIRNTSFVCTSSFHALVFSLLYHKEFYVAFQENSMRAESLLNTLGIEERLLNPNSIVPNPTDTLDYKMIDKKLIELRAGTFEYVRSSLNGIMNEKK